MLYASVPGIYLKVEGGKVLVKSLKADEGDATEKVKITFTKNGKTASMEVMVTIKTGFDANTQITGTILTPSGDPANESVSIAVCDSNGDYLFDVSSDSNGKYRIGGLTVGSTYKLIANTNPNGAYARSNQKTVIITTAKQNIDIILNEVQISGQVKRPDGTPVSERVDVIADNQSTGEGFGFGTDSAGNFRIGGLTDGTYKVHARPNSSSQYAFSYFETVVITGGIADKKSLNDIRLKKAQIQGTVTGPKGESLSGQFVDVFMINSGTGNRTGLGTRDGSYKLGGLAAGQ